MNEPLKKIILAATAVLSGFIAYLFLFGKLFPYSPVTPGFTKHEMNYTISYVQEGAIYDDYLKYDTLIPQIEKIHELRFIKKPEIFIFRDSNTYIHHSPSKARFCVFPNGRLFVTPWAVKEDREGKILLEVYLKHELSHVLIFQHTGILSGIRYPKWLLEGIAVYSSNQMGTSFYPSKSETYKAIAQGNFVPPADFKTRKEDFVNLDVKYRQTFIYSEFGCIVDNLIDVYGKKVFLTYMRSLFHDNDHDKYFRMIFGLDFDEYLIGFKKYVADAYSQIY
jgi:hypothetical protein